MNRWPFLLVGMGLSFGLLGCADNTEATNDFQTVCSYFQELEKLENVDSLTAEERNKFIVARIEKNIPNSAASVSWEAISYAVAEQRYEIFKMGAESVLKETWDCPSMKKLAPLTGVAE